MEDDLDQESLERIQRTFTDRTMVVMRNKANVVYEVEKKVQRMLEEGRPYEQIKRELNILQKYSYKTYIQENIKLLKTNAKKYHQCTNASRT